MSDNFDDTISHNGSDDVVSQLNALFDLEATPNRYSHSCGTQYCSNIACWRVVWMEGACEHMPTEVCALGKIILDDAMQRWDDLNCTNCAAAIVPATLVPMPYG